MLIKDLKPGADIELVAEIIEIQPIRKTWLCLECKKKGINERDKSYGLLNTGEFDSCPTCGAKETTEKGKGVWVNRVTSALIKDESGTIYMDVWNKDIDRLNVGDTIRLVSGYSKERDGKLVIRRGKYGSIVK